MQQLSKVELHLHLDNSLSYTVVHAIDPTVTREIYQQEFVGAARFTNLAHFLTMAHREVALMQTREQLRLVVLDLFEQLQRDHVIYAEMRFAPLLHTAHGLTPVEVVATVNDAVDEGRTTTGIEARVILCTLRHFSAEQSMQTVKLVEQFKDSSVVALDIAGSEADYPLDPHIAAFQYAEEHDIARTAHAGEASGAPSVWETLAHLHPTRIGHGVRSIEDDRLVEELRMKQIHLEVCPSSNVQTNMYPAYSDHPIDHLYQAGVPLNVNTDTRTITPVTLNQEYQKLAQAFGWDEAHFLRCNQDAIRAAFIPEELKRTLMKKLRAGSGLSEQI
jgi:adenosine deaminase